MTKKDNDQNTHTKKDSIFSIAAILLEFKTSTSVIKIKEIIILGFSVERRECLTLKTTI